MQVERQGYMECGLATIAALSGRSLAEVRALGHRLADIKGVPFYRNSVLREVAYRLGGVGLVDLTGLQRNYGSRTAPPALTGDRVKLVSTRRKTLPGVGRGVVRLVFAMRGSRSGHIMPWENGLVYDSDSPTPEVGQTLAQIRAACGRLYKVHYITLDTSAVPGA